MNIDSVWRECLQLAWESYCRGSIPVGAVVCDPEGHVLARGRNRTRETEGEPGHTWGTPLAHAEINALNNLPWHQLSDLTDLTLYTTLEPCPLCTGALYMSGLRKLRFGCLDPWAGGLDMLGQTPYLSRKELALSGPGPSLLEDMVMILMVDDLLRSEGGDHPLLESWREAYPRGVSLGIRCSRRGLLEEARRERVPWAEALTRALDS